MQLSYDERVNVKRLRERYGKRIILFVGRLVYYKGVEHLIDSMREIDGHLIVIGEGALREQLFGQVKSLRLSDKVTFINHLPKKELKLYFNLCDVFVLPSVVRTEAFGLVLLEAMACSKPVVSTELGTGTSFVNLDGVTGLVAPPGSSSSLSQSINRILYDGLLREQMGKSAYKRVTGLFSLKKFSEDYLSAYRAVLSS
jgi:rhamnosyl/mannosyltransferase